MSVIQKMLGAECLDPNDACFAVVLRCGAEADMLHCKATFAHLLGEVHVEAHGVGFLFLFLAQAGIAADTVLPVISTLLDEGSAGVELVETKFVNVGGAHERRHSFTFLPTGEPSQTTIVLAPTHAFGSGDHPSTGLAIEFLEQLAPLATDVLDVGCGTGVLSFVAVKLGATSVLGVDIDDEGVCGAIHNAGLNHLESQVHFENKVLADVAGPFALILANLTYSVLQYLLGAISSLATPGGMLVVSGLQGRQGEDATLVLGDFGWQVTQQKSAGKWQALLAVKSSGSRS